MAMTKQRAKFEVSSFGYINAAMVDMTCALYK